MSSKILGNSILIYFSLFILIDLHAQTPCWVSKTPECKDNNFVYVTGLGFDSNLAIAKNKAEAEAIKTFIVEINGTQMEDATYNEVLINGLEKLKIKGRSVQFKIKRQNFDAVRNVYYVLILFPRNFAREEIRNSLLFPDEILCDDKDEQRKEQIQKREEEEQRQKQEQYRKKAEERQRKCEESLYCKYSNQIYFNGVGGTVYGKVIGITLEGRHGNIFGFGWQGTYGLDLEKYAGFRGAIGVKIYPFKSLFLSANYGTVEMEKSEMQNTNEGHFFYKDPNSMRCDWSYLAGFNLISATGMTLSLNGGYFRDSESRWTFIWGIGIGIGGIIN
ncbi:MAG: hypothetical protein HOO91_20500 [Bacteroidales bacterium]|nr:hypothetical protein [Bacteroidales bacterium]